MQQDEHRDRIAVQDVMLNYAAAVDERDIERYRNCFAENVEVVGFGDQSFNGRQDWLDYVWQALDKYSATQHLLGPVYATIEGDCADARSDVQATHFLVDSTQRFTLWATYLTQLRRNGDQWLITRHELVVRGSSSN